MELLVRLAALRSAQSRPGAAALLPWCFRIATALALLAIPLGCSAITGTPGMENYNEGVSHLQKGEDSLAEQQFKLAIQKNPDNAEAYANLGLIYMNNGWYDGAEEYTRRGINILERTKKTLVEGSTYEQSLSLAYNNLGACAMARALEYELKGDRVSAKARWSEGMNYFRQAVELDRTDSKAQANLQRFRDAYR